MSVNTVKLLVVNYWGNECIWHIVFFTGKKIVTVSCTIARKLPQEVKSHRKGRASVTLSIGET